MYYHVEYLREAALKAVGRYTFLTPKDLHRAFGVSEETLSKDRKKGLIKPMSEATRIPEYSVEEFHAYLLRKKKIVLPRPIESARRAA